MVILTHIQKKYWKYALAGDIECAMCKDGLLFMFNFNDIKHLLDKYPSNAKGNKWYFNETKDREIAEMDDWEKVTVNPQFLYQNFKREDILIEDKE